MTNSCPQLHLVHRRSTDAAKMYGGDDDDDNDDDDDDDDWKDHNVWLN